MYSDGSGGGGLARALAEAHDIASRTPPMQENNGAFMEGIPLAEYAEMPGLSHQAHLEDTKKYLKILDVGHRLHSPSLCVRGSKGRIFTGHNRTLARTSSHSVSSQTFWGVAQGYLRRVEEGKAVKK